MMSLITILSYLQIEDVLFAAGDSIALTWGDIEHIHPSTFINTSFTSLSSSSNLLSPSSDVDIDDDDDHDHIMTDITADVTTEVTEDVKMIEKEEKGKEKGDKDDIDGDVEMKDGDESALSQQADEVREMIWKKLNMDLLISPRKEERCAGVIWLLSIITHCGKNKKVQSLLFDIQVVKKE
jgi:proteasome component ECM29